MLVRADLTLFAHVVKRPDAELDLAQAALLIADADGRNVDVARCLGLLDELGDKARARLQGAPRNDAENQRALEQLLQFLYSEIGLRGNAADYYDPRNSWLDQVLERKLGIPITLAVVLMEVARRAEVAVRGVSFPGHFLARAPGASGTVFVDPFDGHLVTPSELRVLHGRATGQERDPDPRLLEPVDKAQILVRMLNNLRGIWQRSGDAERLASVEARLAILNDSGPRPTRYPS